MKKYYKLLRSLTKRAEKLLEPYPRETAIAKLVIVVVLLVVIAMSGGSVLLTLGGILLAFLYCVWQVRRASS